MKKLNKTPLSLAIGTSLVAGVFTTAAHADSNPFAMTDLANGYMHMAEADYDKKKEGKCGEGKCGGKKKSAEGKCGGSAKAADKSAEGKCGEGKCGGSAKAADKSAEGKCGEGKCGGDK